MRVATSLLIREVGLEPSTNLGADGVRVPCGVAVLLGLATTESSVRLGLRLLRCSGNGLVGCRRPTGLFGDEGGGGFGLSRGTGRLDSRLLRLGDFSPPLPFAAGEPFIRLCGRLFSRGGDGLVGCRRPTDLFGGEGGGGFGLSRGTGHLDSPLLRLGNFSPPLPFAAGEPFIRLRARPFQRRGDGLVGCRRPTDLFGGEGGGGFGLSRGTGHLDSPLLRLGNFSPPLPFVTGEPFIRLRARPFQRRGDGLVGCRRPTDLFGGEGGGGFGLSRGTGHLDSPLLRLGDFGPPLPFVTGEPFIRLRARLFSRSGDGLVGCRRPTDLFGGEGGGGFGLSRGTGHLDSPLLRLGDFSPPLPFVTGEPFIRLRARLFSRSGDGLVGCRRPTDLFGGEGGGGFGLSRGTGHLDSPLLRLGDFSPPLPFVTGEPFIRLRARLFSRSGDGLVGCRRPTGFFGGEGGGGFGLSRGTGHLDSPLLRLGNFSPPLPFAAGEPFIRLCGRLFSRGGDGLVGCRRPTGFFGGEGGGGFGLSRGTGHLDSPLLRLGNFSPPLPFAAGEPFIRLRGRLFSRGGDGLVGCRRPTGLFGGEGGGGFGLSRGTGHLDSPLLRLGNFSPPLPFAAGEPFIRLRGRLFSRGGDGLVGCRRPTGLFGGEGGGGFGLSRGTGRLDSRLLRLGNFSPPLPFAAGEPFIRLRGRLFSRGGDGLVGCRRPTGLFGGEGGGGLTFGCGAGFPQGNVTLASGFGTPAGALHVIRVCCFGLSCNPSLRHCVHERRCHLVAQGIDLGSQRILDAARLLRGFSLAVRFAAHLRDDSRVPDGCVLCPCPQLADFSPPGLTTVGSREHVLGCGEGASRLAGYSAVGLRGWSR